MRSSQTPNTPSSHVERIQLVEWMERRSAAPATPTATHHTTTWLAGAAHFAMNVNNANSDPAHNTKLVSLWINNRIPASIYLQENRAVARKPRDAAAVLFSLKFADDIHYKFKSSQASSQASELQTYRHKTEFNAKWRFKVIQSHVFWSQWKGDKALSNTV